MNSRDIQAETMKYLSIDIAKFIVVETRKINPDYLRFRRHLAKVPLRTIAKNLKCSVAFLSKIEKGRKNCPENVFNEYEKLEIHTTIAKAFSGKMAFKGTKGD